MDKVELHKLQGFLRQAFGNQNLKVVQAKRNPDDAEVYLGERSIATISVDDEDGDRSFALELKIPVERPVLQDYLRRLFENDKLRILPRPKKTIRPTRFRRRLSRRHLPRRSQGPQLHAAGRVLDFDLEDF